MAGAFHVCVPAGFAIVEDHVQPAPRGRRDHGFPVRLLESLAGVQRFVAIAAVTGDNQNLAGHPKPAYRAALPECKGMVRETADAVIDRKSTRLNSNHLSIWDAGCCLEKSE